MTHIKRRNAKNPVAKHEALIASASTASVGAKIGTNPIEVNVGRAGVAVWRNFGA